MPTTQITLKHHEKIKLLADFIGTPVKELHDGPAICMIVDNKGQFDQSPDGDEIFDPYNDLNDAQCVVEKIESMDYGVKRCRSVTEIYIDSTKEVLIRTKESDRRTSLFKALVWFVIYFNDKALQKQELFKKLNGKFWNKIQKAKLHPSWELYKTVPGVYGVVNRNHHEWMAISLQTESREEAAEMLTEAGIVFGNYIR